MTVAAIALAAAVAAAPDFRPPFDKGDYKGTVGVQVNPWFPLDKPAADALEQIKGKDYAGKYALSKKRITLIGISFSSEKRTIVEELVEEFTK